MINQWATIFSKAQRVPKQRFHALYFFPHNLFLRNNKSTLADIVVIFIMVFRKHCFEQIRAFVALKQERETFGQ